MLSWECGVILLILSGDYVMPELTKLSGQLTLAQRPVQVSCLAREYVLGRAKRLHLKAISLLSYHYPHWLVYTRFGDSEGVGVVTSLCSRRNVRSFRKSMLLSRMSTFWSTPSNSMSCTSKSNKSSTSKSKYVLQVHAPVTCGKWYWVL